MTPLELFEAAWARCDQLRSLHAYLAANVTSALQPEEILRAEWSARVSAIDLYVHELIANKLVEIISRVRPEPIGISKFNLSASIVLQNSQNVANFLAPLDLEIREKLERRTFQNPDDIADGIRYISDVELWNEVALADGATSMDKVSRAKSIKAQLTQIVNRRNKIVHEADLQPGIPRVPWPISSNDLETIREFLEKVIKSIDVIIG